MTYIPQITAGRDSIETMRVSAPAMVGTDQVMYMGLAHAGASVNAAAWQIKKITDFNDGSSSILFANGNAEYGNIWANHASLIYS